ncbi:unnamed protein product [Ilex paraguariensis]|uniref:WIBG Mago-binding domain-containing protein n=1 Tax=Ilex paraguariensis TaxID=185542 RepID=A0ABC8UD84_9AQUA
MASSTANGRGGGEEEVNKLAAQIGKTLKEGERILAPTRRPDGSLRKPIRIRANYVPQDEIAIYQSKGTLQKEMAASQEVPPGYDPVLDAKPKTKSAKRNERKKEKRAQASLDKDMNLCNNEVLSADDAIGGSESAESVASQINGLTISASARVTPPSNSTEYSTPGDPVPDVDKKIRALKKKIRLAESQQEQIVQQEMKPEQLEKMTKLEGWRKELKLLEDKKAELATS